MKSLHGIFLCLVLFSASSCNGDFNGPALFLRPTEAYINPEGLTLQNRVDCPKGFERIPGDSTSFAFFLRNLPVKPYESDVKKYDGADKKAFVHVAVIDMPIGETDLQQCADSGIRLYAEYLYYSGQPDKIHFNFTNGDRCSWQKYAAGWRVKVNGNTTEWYKATGADYSYGNFSRYLDLVYLYAGSYSLSKEMKKVPIADILPGDFLVHPGFPGHVEIVMDVCVNPVSGEKLFLLAQGFTPAQEIELLKNESEPKQNPWYSVTEEMINTPQATFRADELMRFK